MTNYDAERAGDTRGSDGTEHQDAEANPSAVALPLRVGAGNLPTRPGARRLLTDSDKHATRPASKKRGWSSLVWLCIVVGICAGSVAMECAAHILARVYADPLPHSGYFAAYILAIAAPILVHRVLHHPARTTLSTGYAVTANAFSLLMAGMMSLALLPTSPFAVILCAFFGFGLLGLSSYFLLALSIYQATRLRALIRETGVRPGRTAVWSAGATVGATALVLFIHPLVAGTLLTQALRRGISPREERTAATRLHALGGENAVLMLCYRTQLPLWEAAGVVLSGGASETGVRDSWLRWGGDIRTDDPSVKQARRLYFLMTGESFGKAPVPWTIANKHPQTWITDMAQEDVGGTRVGRNATGLSLREKTGTVTPDTASGTGECDLSLTFANESGTANEARAEILLPPGAVPDGVWLWINGTRHAAAFGPQTTVRRVYQKVAVVQRRDPLLVTMPIPGKLLLQCFPIPAHGTMRVRLALTMPLSPDANDHQELTYALPAWGATNFTGAGRLADALMTRDVATGKPPTLPLKLPIGVAWDTRAVARVPVHLLIAFDASAGMRTAFGARERDALRSAVRELPEGSTVRYAATDGPLQSDDTGLLRFNAGRDNVPSLEREARDELAGDAVLLYLHAGTPESVSDPAPLAEAIKRLPPTVNSRPRFVSLLLAPDAPDTIGDRVAMQQSARSVSVAQYRDVSEAIRATVAGIARGEDSPSLATQGTPAACRLRGYRDALAVWYRANNFGSEALEAARNAARARLVTPLSGAVVLDTADAYKENGLEAPADADKTKKPDTTLVTPEPGTWLLLLLSVAAWLLSTRVHRTRVA